MAYRVLRRAGVPAGVGDYWAHRLYRVPSHAGPAGRAGIVIWKWRNRTIRRLDQDARLAEAEAALKTSRIERTRARKVAQELQELRSENHITERIHRAMRGGEGQ